VKKLALEEMVERERYAQLRPAYRAAVIDHKRARRLSVGENITLLFEDRETLRFQVQEMMWVEGIAAPDKIQHELDTYNELMPAETELSATLFIEITDTKQIRPALDRLVGVDEHVSLVLGKGDDEVVVPARFDPKQMEEERISAVQYIKFGFDEAAMDRFCDPNCSARVRTDHPNYRREGLIGPELRESLVRGLKGNPVSLLPTPPATPRRSDSTLFESEVVRAFRPARPEAPGHLVIEAIDPNPSLLDAGPELLEELLAAVRRAAAEVVREHGRCRVQTDVGAGADRLRWHVYAPPS
jgi:hypothetical protein